MIITLNFKIPSLIDFDFEELCLSTGFKEGTIYRLSKMHFDKDVKVFSTTHNMGKRGLLKWISICNPNGEVVGFYDIPMRVIVRSNSKLHCRLELVEDSYLKGIFTCNS